jgi:putative aldouronate transport system permease protein
MVNVSVTKRAPEPKRKSTFFKELGKQIDLQLLVVPSIIMILIFSYVPMYGIIMAFQNFQLGDKPGFSKWVGWMQFKSLIFDDPNFLNVLRNTLVISSLKLLICFPAPIILAVLFNEVQSVKFKRTVQTISYLPHFISWVVGATLMFDFLSSDNGAVNTLLKAIGLINKDILFFGDGKYFWPIAVGTDLWKELGWNAIIYIAAITSIDSELYEAAEIDGAGRYAKMWHITIASIRPTIILLFIFTVGNLLNANFDQVMMLTNQMTNAMLRQTADIIDTYVYRMGISQGRFSYAAAAGLFKAVINFGLLLGANALAGKLGNTALF